MKRVLLWISLFLLTSCIEYRWEARNKLPELYFGSQYSNTRKDQDPKLGPKAKLYLNTQGPTRVYIGGHFSKNRLTGNAGVIYYHTKRVSFEVGYRTLLHELDEQYSTHLRTNNWYNDPSLDNIIYIGGRIIF